LRSQIRRAAAQERGSACRANLIRGRQNGEERLGRRRPRPDSNSFRKSLRKDGIKPVIPGRSNRKKRIRHDKQAYKDRNVIERCYCRLKDFRRIATRYDKLAPNYFSALCLVAAVAFWL
jgi:hypothetical protein